MSSGYRSLQDAEEQADLLTEDANTRGAAAAWKELAQPQRSLKEAVNLLAQRQLGQSQALCEQMELIRRKLKEVEEIPCGCCRARGTVVDLHQQLQGPGARRSTHKSMRGRHSTATAKSRKSAFGGESPRQTEEEKMLNSFTVAKGWGTPGGEEPKSVQKELSQVPSKRDDVVPVGEGGPSWREVVNSDRFDIFWGILIIANAIVMALNLEYQGDQIALKLGLAEDDGGWPAATASFMALEHIFAISFLVELTLRFAANGVLFAKSFANWMDVFLVVFSVIDLYVLAPMGKNIPNVNMARLLRIGKLVRVLRVVRVMKIFRELRVLVRTIVSSMRALGWSMVLLILIELVASIFMAQVLNEFCNDESQDLEIRRKVHYYYGTWSKSMLTIFEITLAPGAWPKAGRMLINEVSGWFSLFFFFYVSFVTFAVIRVITAVFLKETLNVAAQDQEKVTAERMKKRDQYIHNLRQVFEAADASGDGTITLEELTVIMELPQVKTWLSVLELEVHEVSGLFRLLDNGDGVISFEEFLSGVMRLRGTSKQVDVVTLLYENKKVMKSVHSIQWRLDAIGGGPDPNERQDSMWQLTEDVWTGASTHSPLQLVHRPVT